MCLLDGTESTHFPAVGAGGVGRDRRRRHRHRDARPRRWRPARRCEDACSLANHAAGVVVAKFGPATVSPQELAQAVERQSLDQAGLAGTHVHAYCRAEPEPEPIPCLQCRKCRRPVNTIARPCSSAAAITSASRTEPPGWTTAVAPAAATASRPSRNGKNASDAATEPASGRDRLPRPRVRRPSSPRPSPRRRGSSGRRRWPASGRRS